MAQEKNTILIPIHGERFFSPKNEINAFFDVMGLIDAKKYISTFLDAVYEPDVWNYDEPSELVDFYKHLIQLMNAVWFLQQQDNSKQLANLSVTLNLEAIQPMRMRYYCPPDRYEQAWYYFPRSLNIKEYINPYLVFNEFFEFHTLEYWKNELYQLLSIALCCHTIADYSKVINLLRVKQLLNKLLDACHLIHVREGIANECILSSGPVTLKLIG